MMQVWPAIDIRGGRCVRLRQGDFASETVFHDDPFAVACHWKDQGAQHLHLVDLDGARGGIPVHLDLAVQIARETQLECQFGGGLRTLAAIQDALESGITRVIIGTGALEDGSLLPEAAARFPGRILVGLDVRNGRIATHGWERDRETLAIKFVHDMSRHDLAGVVVTDIATDGMLTGPNLDYLRHFREATPLPLLASGGIATRQDVLAVRNLGLQGVIVGRALYEGTLTLADALAVSQLAEATEGNVS